MQVKYEEPLNSAPRWHLPKALTAFHDAKSSKPVVCLSQLPCHLPCYMLDAQCGCLARTQPGFDLAVSQLPCAQAGASGSTLRQIFSAGRCRDSAPSLAVLHASVSDVPKHFMQSI